MKRSDGPISTRSGWCIRLPLILVLVALGAPLPTVSSAASDFAVVKTINVDFIPFGVTASPDGQTMWVANSGGTPFFGGPPNSNKITIIDIRTLEEEPDKITVGNFPEHIAFTRNGSHAVVTNSSDDTVSVIDTQSRTVTQTVDLTPAGLAFPFGIIFSRNDRKIYVTSGAGLDNAIAVLDSRDIDDLQLAGTLPVNGYPGIPDLNPENHQLLVPSSPAVIGTASLFVINPNSNKILREFSIPINNAFANDIAVTPDGRFAYVSIFAFSGGTGGVWVVDLKHLKTVTTIDTGDPSVYGMSITPDGRFVLATNFTNGEVAVIDPGRNQVIATVPVGHQPNQVAVTLDGRLAFVTNQGDTTVSVFSIPREKDD
jgi:YVTN family beta-propeller protein